MPSRKRPTSRLRLRIFAGDINPIQKSFTIPYSPTQAAPGTPEKFRELFHRHARGEQLWHPDDARQNECLLLHLPGWDETAGYHRPTLKTIGMVDRSQLLSLEQALVARKTAHDAARFDRVARSWLVPDSEEYRARKEREARRLAA